MKYEYFITSAKMVIRVPKIYNSEITVNKICGGYGRHDIDAYGRRRQRGDMMCV